MFIVDCGHCTYFCENGWVFSLVVDQAITVLKGGVLCMKRWHWQRWGGVRVHMTKNWHWLEDCRHKQEEGPVNDKWGIRKKKPPIPLKFVCPIEPQVTASLNSSSWVSSPQSRGWAKSLFSENVFLKKKSSIFFEKNGNIAYAKGGSTSLVDELGLNLTYAGLSHQTLAHGLSYTSDFQTLLPLHITRHNCFKNTFLSFWAAMLDWLIAINPCNLPEM